MKNNMCSDLFTNVSGINIRYKQIGQGPDILFIHGTPGPLEGWPTNNLIDGLSKKYRLTMYDRPGHGQSPVNFNAEYTIRQNAETALALIDNLKLDNPLIVGHSYGGAVSLCIATMQPGNVAGFLVVSPMIYPDVDSPFIFKIVLIPMIGRLFIKGLIKLSGKAIIKAGLSTMFSPNMDAVPSDYVDVNAAFMKPMTIESFFREMIAANKGLQLMEKEYYKINRPVTLVHGESDRVLNHESQSKAFHEAFPKTKLFLMKNTGHMVQYARPKELIDIIDNILGK